MDLEAALGKTLLVIPSINGGTLLRRMLPTVGLCSENILVVDQGSTDDTAEICLSFSVEVLHTGRPHTYTEVCNIGAEIAKQRGYQFVFFGNNDVVFVTDVIRECVSELLEDPKLGIVAPSQIIVDEKANGRARAYRVFWNLKDMIFLHDVAAPHPTTERYECDFCEMTLAGIRLSAIEEVGFLDDDFGFYYEDADFGFRLRAAGYSCAYLPKSIIERWTSSTFETDSPRERYYSNKNKRLFRSKHISVQVDHKDHKSTGNNSWNRINRYLHAYLNSMGMIDEGKPELIFAHPGTAPFDHLHTVWETTRLPSQWLQYRKSYKSVTAPSTWCVDILRAEGFDARHVPYGVESDIFNPWGDADRRYNRTTFLWSAKNKNRKGLDVMLRAWQAFHRLRPLAHLIVMGSGVASRFEEAATLSYRSNLYEIKEYLERSISVYEIVGPMTDAEIAQVYRGVDFTVCTSRSEGFGFVVAESLACGTPAIFAAYAGTFDFVYPGALTFNGDLAVADYSDKGFGDVGEWWEPRTEELVARLIDAYDMSEQDYRRLAQSGVNEVRARFSWRATCFALKAALEEAVVDLPVRSRFPSTPTACLASTSEETPDVEIPKCLFIGYAEGNLGLGQSFRDDVVAAVNAHVPIAVYPFRVGIEDRLLGPFMPDLYQTDRVFQINVIVVAPDQVPNVFSSIPQLEFKETYNVLRTYWELPSAPEEWRPYLKHVHELWVPNEFVANALVDIFDGPMVVIPPVINVTIEDSYDRNYYGMEPNRFYFLYSFDYLSSPYRKNPVGVVKAFEDAFVTKDESVGLVLKSIGPQENYPEIHLAIQATMANDRRIISFNRTMKRDEMLGLISASDCYISLHRSEGFGAGMAEAMMLGKPVIGTDFSGNRCFLNERTGFPVPYVVRDVLPHEYPWSAGQIWAEPVHSEAAAIMRRVVDDPKEAERRALVGQEFVAARFDGAAVGRSMKARLTEISRELRRRKTRAAD